LTLLKMSIKNNYEAMQEALSILLELERLPVGIKFIKTKEEYEAVKAKEPKSGLPYCTAVAKASNSGESYKLDIAHNRCAAASTALGMLPVSEYRLSGQMHADLKVYKDLEVSRGVAHDMVYCQEKNFGVLVQPLGLYEKEKPDVVILISTPKWAMRLLQGYAYNFGQLKNIKMAGMCAICQECTSYPFVKKQPNVSMLCAGTRCVGQWKEHELGIGIPADILRELIDGIWHTIDPMEPKKVKEKLMTRLQEAGLAVPDIDLNNNYYSHAYGIPKK